MRSSIYWYLPDRRWWLRLVTIPLILVVLAGVLWWCVVAAQTWRWPAALAHLGVQALLVAALWLVAVLPNEILLLAQAWRRQRRRAAAVRGRQDALPPADLATDLAIPAADNLTLPVTWNGRFPKPDFSLAALSWQIVSLLVVTVIVLPITIVFPLITLWFAITGQMASYTAYLRENGTTITPLQIALVTALLFPVAFTWFWRARQPDRAVSFTLTVSTDGITWQPQGLRAAHMRWEDLSSLEVALPPYDPALPAPRIHVCVVRSRQKVIWWYGFSMAMTLIAHQSGLPITTLEPSLSTQLPRAWHILSQRNSYQVVAGYLLLFAAAIALVPPTPIDWLNTVFGEVILGGAVLQLAAFTWFSAQSTWRYRRIRRHPLHIVLPPPPSDVGATYIITYQALWLGRLLTFLAGLSLALGLPLFVLWEIQAASGKAGGEQFVNVLLGIATIPLSVLGVNNMLRAVIRQSTRYGVEVGADTITLRYLGRIGKRAPRVITVLSWDETAQLLIRVHEGRVGGYRIIGTEGEVVPWPALPGQRVIRSDGGPAITAAELTALVAAHSGHAPQIWHQTTAPSAAAQQALRDATIINRAFAFDV